MVNSKTTTPTEQEAQLIEKLRSNPQLLDLFNEVTQVYEDDPKEFESLHEIETYLLGSTRRVTKVMEQLCGLEVISTQPSLRQKSTGAPF